MEDIDWHTRTITSAFCLNSVEFSLSLLQWIPLIAFFEHCADENTLAFMFARARWREKTGKEWKRHLTYWFSVAKIECFWRSEKCLARICLILSVESIQEIVTKFLKFSYILPQKYSCLYGISLKKRTWLLPCSGDMSKIASQFQLMDLSFVPELIKVSGLHLMKKGIWALPLSRTYLPISRLNFIWNIALNTTFNYYTVFCYFSNLLHHPS